MLAAMSQAAPEAQTVVMKFGGTSVGDAERIARAARRIAKAKEDGNRVVAVLSARGKTTDELIRMAYEVSPRPHPREMDMLLSTGERISCALASMVLNDLGYEAVSFSGSQAGIVTDTSHTKARILDVRADRIERALEQNQIVLVAGFQGTSASVRDESSGEYQIHGEITTLGRGGSDTTAVAIAAALNAEVCEIYTDVSGVFSADPRIVPDARKLPYVSFEEMLEMAASGAGVLQLRSVEYARNHGVRIHCRSSFEDGPGTFVLTEEETMERPLVTAVTHSTDEARVTLTGLPDTPGVAGRVLTALAEANINVDMIIQNEPQTDGHLADMSFTVPRADLDVARETLEGIQPELGFGRIATDAAMGKVSLVGAGMKSHPGVAAKTFVVLGDAGVNIEMISTSPIKISCVVREEDVERAVRDLHAAFELGEDAIRKEDPRGDHRPVVG
jgi:aspartate kinase